MPVPGQTRSSPDYFLGRWIETDFPKIPFRRQCHRQTLFLVGSLARFPARNLTP